MTARADADTGFVYWPVWDSKHEAIGVYAINAAARQGGETVYGYSTLGEYADRDLEAVVDLDIMMLEQAVLSIGKVIGEGANFTVATPIFLRGLNAAWAAPRYQAAFDRIPRYIRQYLLFIIVADRGAVRLSDFFLATMKVADYCAAPVIQVSGEIEDTNSFRKIHAGAIGRTVYDMNVEDPEVARSLVYFSDYARRNGMSVFVSGVQDPMHAVTLKALGIRYITGPFTGMNLAEPKDKQAFGVRDLLQRAPDRAIALQSPDLK